MTHRPRQAQGTFAFEPDTYGHSHLGAPLQVWRPSGSCELLVFAAIHGEEGETASGLSRALRYLSEPSPHSAVVLAANPDGLSRGTRCNARGVELNRNFPTQDWRPDLVTHRLTMDLPSDITLSPGASPGSEPETQALIALIEELKPKSVVALHAPLECIDDPNDSDLGRWLAERTGMPMVADVGYPTPGSFGTWGAEQGLPVVTYEFGLITPDELVAQHVPVLVDLLTQPR